MVVPVFLSTNSTISVFSGSGFTDNFYPGYGFYFPASKMPSNILLSIQNGILYCWVLEFAVFP